MADRFDLGVGHHAHTLAKPMLVLAAPPRILTPRMTEKHIEQQTTLAYLPTQISKVPT